MFSYKKIKIKNVFTCIKYVNKLLISYSFVLKQWHSYLNYNLNDKNQL